jgi:SRSO17 transposase
VRNDLRQYAVQHLGSPDGVLIVDETGFLKKGAKPVGVKRQYSRTAGRIENAQVGVFLAYRSAAGHALIDRSLYLPKEWVDDEARRREAKVPESVTFATNPELARQMQGRTLDAGVPAKWVTADEVYGSDYKFRRFCEDRGLHYVVATSKQTRLFLNGSRLRIDEHTGEIKPGAWRRLSCGSGTKGEGMYDWAFVSWPGSQEEDFTRGLLVRRSISDPDDLAHTHSCLKQRAFSSGLATVVTFLARLPKQNRRKMPQANNGKQATNRNPGFFTRESGIGLA